jgi:hypothetical protein
VTWNALVLCIILCVVVLCAGCCITLSSVAALVYNCCVYCEENITVRMKLFVHVSIIMVYIFNLFHMVTAVYNEGSGFYFEKIQHCL